MSLFAPDAPRRPSMAEQLRQSNATLPDGVAVSYRPFGPGGVRLPKPYRVTVDGREIERCGSFVAAVFLALQQRPRG